LAFDSEENIVIDTTAGLDFNGAIVVSYSGDCADIQGDSITIPISFIVCGGETITVKESAVTRFKFAVGKDEKDITIDKSQLTSYFANSNPNCGIKGFKLTNDRRGADLALTRAKHVKLDATTDELKILNNLNVAKNFKFFIQAESSGGAFAYKKMRYTVTANIAPYLQGYRKLKTLPTVKLTVDPTDYDGKTFTIKFPKAVDKEKNTIKYEWTNTEHKWITKLAVVGKKYQMKIDKTKIKATDAGVVRIGLTLQDDKYDLTRLENVYYLPIDIKYVKPKALAANSTGSSDSTANATTSANATVPTNATAATSAAGTTAAAAANSSTAADGTTSSNDTASTAANTNDIGATSEDDAKTADSTKKAAKADPTKPAVATTTTTDENGKETKAVIVKSGGQLAGLKINLDGDAKDKKKTEEKEKEEKPAPPPVTSLPVST